ncbi:hypothetical protein J1N35_018929, partial [Gossypium stocksii]
HPMGKEGSNEEAMAKVSARFERIVSAPKFKQCIVSYSRFSAWLWHGNCTKV